MNAIRSVATLFWKDFKAIFVSPLFYIITFFCTAIWSLMFYTGIWQFSQLSLQVASRSRGEMQGLNIQEHLFKNHVGLVNFLMIFAVAALTMRLISEEKRQKTFDLLWTSPVEAWQIVFAKFLSGVAASWVLIFVSSLYPISASLFADFAWGPLLSSYIGMAMVAACYVAAGLFASALTQSSVLSVFIALVFNLSLFLVAIGADLSTNPVVISIFKHIAIMTHFNDLLSGVIKLSSLVLFLSLCLFLGMLAENAIKFSMVSLEGKKVGLASKILFILSGIFGVTTLVSSFLMGAWYDFLWVLLGLAIMFLGLAVALEFTLFSSFLALKTTRRGINVGAVGALIFVLLVAINYITYKRDVTWDVTPNQVNTLSSQTQKVLAALDDHLRIVLLFADPRVRTEVEQQVGPLIRNYENYTKKVVYENHNVVKKPNIAKEFGFNRGAYGLFMSYKGRKKVVKNVSEEDFTKVMTKLTKDEEKVIYFVTGHGEFPLDAKENEPQALSFLKEELESVFYKVKSLNLRNQDVPENASLIAIIGPQRALLDGEIKKLTDFAFNGGRLLIAADPAQEHNVGELTEKLGVEFADHIVLDDTGQLVGRGPTTSFGIPSKASEITRDFPESPSLHTIASPLKKTADAKNFKYEELITSQTKTQSVSELKEDAPVVGNGPFTLGYLVTGKLKRLEPEDGTPTLKTSDSEFKAIIFGDSDFLSNVDIKNQLNYNLALNSINYLTDDTDVIGIRPKMAETTQINMLQTEASIYLLAFILPLPLLFLGGGAVTWFRRRSS